MKQTTLELNDVKTTPISLEEIPPIEDVISAINSDKTNHPTYFHFQHETVNFSNFMVNLYFRFKDRISQKYRMYYYELCGMNADVLYNNTEKRITIYKVAPTVTIILQKNYIEMCSLTFSPHIHNTIELTNIVIPDGFRGLGFGTYIMKDIIQSVKDTNNRLYLFPGVTDIEKRNGMNPDEQVPKLTKWYGRLGFLTCYPEYMEVTSVVNKKQSTVGVKGYMVIN